MLWMTRLWKPATFTRSATLGIAFCLTLICGRPAAYGTSFESIDMFHATDFDERANLPAAADHRVFLPSLFEAYCGQAYIDDFSDPTSGWPILNTGSILYEYHAGEYRIFHQNANRWTGASLGHIFDGSESIVIEGRMADNREAVWGIVFGLNENWTRFHTFEILPATQTWLLLRFNSQTGWHLIDEGVTTAINQGTGVNSLHINRDGDQLLLYVNDTLLTVYSAPNGRVGLTAGSLQPNVDLRYDNYIFADDNCLVPHDGTANASMSATTMVRPQLEQLFDQSRE